MFANRYIFIVKNKQGKIIHKEYDDQYVYDKFDALDEADKLFEAAYRFEYSPIRLIFFLNGVKVLSLKARSEYCFDGDYYE